MPSKRSGDDGDSNENAFYTIYTLSSLVYRYWRFWEIIALCKEIMKLSGESSVKATTKRPAKAWGGRSVWLLTLVSSRTQFNIAQGGSTE